MDVPRLDAVVRGTAGVDQRLPGTGSASDGQLLEGSPVPSLGVPLEVGEHQHGVVDQDVLPNEVALQDPSVWDIPLDVGPLAFMRSTSNRVHPCSSRSLRWDSVLSLTPPNLSP